MLNRDAEQAECREIIAGAKAFALEGCKQHSDGLITAHELANHLIAQAQVIDSCVIKMGSWYL